MSHGIFITGTDTGVGKTIVTAAIAAVLSQRGYRVGVMKPAESGCQMIDGRLLPQDALFLQYASGCMAPLDTVNPYALLAPLAPALAANMEGVSIDIEHICQCYQQLVAEHDIVLVEGAGGLLVPLTDQVTMHDLAVKLDLPILIVARNVLGVINHTALTVTVARQRSRVLGVILNNPMPDQGLATNRESLSRWGRAPLLCEVPYMPVHGHDMLLSLGQWIDVEYIVSSSLNNSTS